MKAPVLLASFATVLLLCLAGCGGGDGGSNSDPAPAPTDSGGTNNPPTIVGKTINFTVTARQGLSEPVGATYSIVFGDTMYTLNPSPQNLERTNSINGAYTYDATSATAVLSATENVTGTFTFTSAQQGTVYWMELDGEMQDATFVVI
jgi:hypothetical protein